MPDTRIETKRGWIADKAALCDAVPSALIAALKIKPEDRSYRVIEHEPDAFLSPPLRGDRYTIVEITLMIGRSADAKRELYQLIVENLAALGVPPLDVKIILIEVAADNFGMRGGLMASEIDLGFNVRV
jgi:phenylpyruvate tautomerase PptA (4-oxalocrotonate tautomerase family)